MQIYNSSNQSNLGVHTGSVHTELHVDPMQNIHHTETQPHTYKEKYLLLQVKSLI